MRVSNASGGEARGKKNSPSKSVERLYPHGEVRLGKGMGDTSVRPFSPEIARHRARFGLKYQREYQSFAST